MRSVKLLQIRPYGVPLVLLTIVLLLSGWGLVTVFSASYPRAVMVHGLDATHYLMQQVGNLALGLLLAALLLRAPVALLRYHPWMWWLYGLSLISLYLPLTPLGDDLDREAHRWVRLFGMGFQPWEFAKIGLTIWMAAFLANNRDRLNELLTLATFLLLGLLVPTLILQQQPHLGAVMVLVIVALALYFLAGGAWSHLTAAALLMAIIGVALARGYQSNRILAWLHPEDYPKETAQLRYGLAAAAEGGWFGRGLGNSVRKFMYLPECYTDSIFPIVAEECGWLAILVLLGLFTLLMRSGLEVAQMAPTPFEQLLGAGATILITSSALLNIAVVTQLVPQTGLPLPFFSYGGSHLLSAFINLGLLLHLSRRATLQALQTVS